MAKSKSIIQQSKLGCLVLLAIATMLGLSQPVRSELTQSANTSSNPVKLPKLPDNGTPIGRRRGGTSRNDCPASDTSLIALVPGQDTSIEEGHKSLSFLASTVAEHPTIWVYLPQPFTNSQVGEFVFQNEVGEDIYRKSLTLPQTAGIIGINLPSSPEYSLKTGQKYHWYFKVYCGEQKSEDGYYYVDSWIERVALTPELEMKLQNAQSAAHWTYFDKNIWYDALTTLGKLLQANSTNYNLQKDWAKMLQSVELSNLLQEPIVKLYE